MKEKLHSIFFNPNDKFGKFVNAIVIFLIVLNALVIMLESLDAYKFKYADFFDTIEVITITIFTIEYILRVYASDYKKGHHSGQTKLHYMLSFMGVIDLLSILPFYIPFSAIPDLRFLRILRLFRLFRVFKILKLAASLDLIWRVIKSEKRPLLITSFASLILLVFSSFVIYEVEHSAQPLVFDSIFSSLWWSVETLTTVGYGDIYPITPLGKIISSFVAILGIAFVAMPSGIIASGFIQEIKVDKIKGKAISHCPYCGEKLTNFNE